MVMLKPEAICLISQEINCERAKLQQLLGDEEFTYDNRRKAFQVVIQTNAEQKYAAIVEMARKENFQGYQMRREQIIADNNEVHGDIVQQMVKADAGFFSSFLPRCQDYIDCVISPDEQGYKPVPLVSRTKTMRNDLNERMTDTMYALHKLHVLLGDGTGVEEVQRMIREGIVTRRDLKALIKLSKAAAEAENVELSKEEQAQVAEVEALSN